eukprot:1048792-Pelagomonas_calceolata.AAC.3
MVFVHTRKHNTSVRRQAVLQCEAVIQETPRFGKTQQWNMNTQVHTQAHAIVSIIHASHSTTTHTSSIARLHQDERAAPRPGVPPGRAHLQLQPGTGQAAGINTAGV